MHFFTVAYCTSFAVCPFKILDNLKDYKNRNNSIEPETFVASAKVDLEIGRACSRYYSRNNPDGEFLFKELLQSWYNVRLGNEQENEMSTTVESILRPSDNRTIT